MPEIKYIFPYWGDTLDDDDTPPKSDKVTFSDSLEDE